MNPDLAILLMFLLGILFGIIPSALTYRRQYIRIRALYHESLDEEYRIGYLDGMDYMTKKIAKENQSQAPKSLQFPIDL